MARALIVVDMQQAFDDAAFMDQSSGDNPALDENVTALIAGWRERGEPVVFVRHDSVEEGSALTPGEPGNALRPSVTGEPDLFVTKDVNSSFLGEPDLEEWLRERAIAEVVVCGIQTNMCVETTCRHGANLGFDVTLALDACRTFDLPGYDGGRVTAA